MIEKNIIKEFESIEDYVDWSNKLIEEDIFVKKHKVNTRIENLLVREKDNKTKVIAIINVSISYKGKDKMKTQCVKDVFDSMLEKEPLFKGKEMVRYEEKEIPEEDKTKNDYFNKLLKDSMVADENKDETLFERHFDLKQSFEKALVHGPMEVECTRIIRKLFKENKILITIFGPEWQYNFEVYHYKNNRYLSIYSDELATKFASLRISVTEDKDIKITNYYYRLSCMKSEVIDKNGHIVENNVLRIMLLNQDNKRMVIFDLDIENELMVMTNGMLRKIIINMIDTTERTENYIYNIKTEGFYIGEKSSLILKTLINGQHIHHYHRDTLEPDDIKDIIYISPRKRILNHTAANIKYHMDDYDFNFDKMTSDFLDKTRTKMNSTINHYHRQPNSIDKKLGLYYFDNKQICAINHFIKDIIR